MTGDRVMIGVLIVGGAVGLLMWVDCLVHIIGRAIKKYRRGNEENKG